MNACAPLFAALVAANTTLPSATITFVHAHGAGGLGDIFKGIITAYVAAFLTHRAFGLNWPEVVGLLEATPLVRWQRQTQHSTAAHRIIDSGYDRFDAFLRTRGNVTLTTNLDGTSTLLSACLRVDGECDAARAHLLLANGGMSKGCILHALFAPTRTLASDELGPVDVGVHMRFGGASKHLTWSDPPRHPATNESLQLFIDAARRARRTTADRVLVVSDSANERDRFAHMAPFPVVLPLVEPAHVDRAWSDRRTWISALRDLFALARADTLVLSRSGFGFVAALLSLVTHSSPPPMYPFTAQRLTIDQYTPTHFTIHCNATPCVPATPASHARAPATNRNVRKHNNSASPSTR